MANNDSFGSSEMIYPPVTQSGEPGQAMLPASPLGMPAMGGMSSHGPEILYGTFNQTWLFNCLRRRWVMAVLLGVLFAGLAAYVSLLLFPSSSTVTALIEVRESTNIMEKKRVLLPQQLKVFHDTQAAKLKSQFVLQAALKLSSVSQTEAVKKEEPDPVTWLQDELRVKFSGETLEISFTGEEDVREIKTIINAVIEAYKREVLLADNTLVKELRDSMERLHEENSELLGKEIEKYETLSAELGGAESELAKTQLQMLVNEIRQTNVAIGKKEDALNEYKITYELTTQQARSNDRVDEAVAYEIDKDQMLANYKAEEFQMLQQIRVFERNAKRSNSPQIKRLRKSLASLQQESAQYRREMEANIRREYKSKPNPMLGLITREFMLRNRVVKQDIALLNAKLEEITKEMQQKGERSGALAMMKQKISHLQLIGSEMDYKLQSMEIQNQASEEHTFNVLQHASAKTKINTTQRYLLAIMGGVAAFCATCYGVALIEFRSRRLNGASDLDEGLGLRVLGVLPSVSSRKAMASGSILGAQISESIDNVRATLMHDSTTSKRQVILIASPATMEGTTTVASHLALSLARAGRRTLLVDGDIRDPALHKLFGMDGGQGLCEVLRSEIDVTDAVSPTSSEGLWLLAAGQCDMDAVHMLATDQPQPIFQKLREEFDFIIIDGAPVIGLSDTISIGQHVDGVILTVLRDHSEVRKVYQAMELLKSMGIRLLGSVVNGVPLKSDHRVAKMHKQAAKQPRKIAKAAKKTVVAATAVAAPAAVKTEVKAEEIQPIVSDEAVDMDDFNMDLKEEIDIDFDDLGIDKD